MLKTGLYNVSEDKIAATFDALAQDVVKAHAENASQGLNTYPDLGENHGEVAQLYAETVYFNRLSVYAPSDMTLQNSIEYDYDKFSQDYVDKVRSGSLSRADAITQSPLLVSHNSTCRALLFLEILKVNATVDFIDVTKIRLDNGEKLIDFQTMARDFPEFIQYFNTGPTCCSSDTGMELREKFVMKQKFKHVRNERNPVLHTHTCGARHISPFRETAYPNALHQYDPWGKSIAINLNGIHANASSFMLQKYIGFITAFQGSKPENNTYVGYMLPRFSCYADETCTTAKPPEEIQAYWNRLCRKNSTPEFMY